MTPSEQKLLLYNNLEFIFLDMSETCRAQKNDIAKRLGWTDKKEAVKLSQELSECKRTYNRLINPYKSLLFAITDYKAIVRKTENDTQEQFGEDSDILLELIMTAIDRSGDDNDKMREIIDKIKEQPSKLNL